MNDIFLYRKIHRNQPSLSFRNVLDEILFIHCKKSRTYGRMSHKHTDRKTNVVRKDTQSFSLG